MGTGRGRTCPFENVKADDSLQHQMVRGHLCSVGCQIRRPCVPHEFWPSGLCHGLFHSSRYG
eukprot:1696245-Heterocapsa_arctica.AAC.1